MLTVTIKRLCSFHNIMSKKQYFRYPADYRHSWETGQMDNRAHEGSLFSACFSRTESFADQQLGERSQGQQPLHAIKSCLYLLYHRDLWFMGRKTLLCCRCSFQYSIIRTSTLSWCSIWRQKQLSFSTIQALLKMSPTASSTDKSLCIWYE